LGTPIQLSFVVDDYEPWHGLLLASVLQKYPELEIVGEVADGLEAVQKAVELHPDVILLDIGLPTVDGIEVARRLRRISAESKILFVSQESSDDMVQEALSAGASGYVVKTNASDLLKVMNAVLEGRQFVSFGLSNQNFN
jgi:DNA-binding NarL/FixJ family response regulator